MATHGRTGRERGPRGLPREARPQAQRAARGRSSTRSCGRDATSRSRSCCGIVRRKRADIGRTTIYRSLKLFKDAGLASELTYGGEARFEPLWNRDHHDHFICGTCGEIFEFKSPEIEQIQETIARGIGFVIEGHRHHILGRCRKCAAKSPRPGPRR